jgi:hypothetical protein
MKLVGMLVEQISGSIRIERGGGTKFVLEFPWKPVAYSGANLPPVPAETCHLFRSKVATHSGANLPILRHLRQIILTAIYRPIYF